MIGKKAHNRLSWRDASWLGTLILTITIAGCNSPYPDEDEDEKVFYASFYQEPQHLDPARTYSAGAAVLQSLALESPFHYDYLERPYTLDKLAPLLATKVPSKPSDRDVSFGGKTVKAKVYRIELRQGVLYQDHPCFVEANLRLTAADLEGVENVADLPRTATREVVAGDFVFGIRRLADSRLACPIYSALAKNLLGMSEYRDHLNTKIKSAREIRREAAGAFYVRDVDEKYNPIRVDYADGAEAFPFVREIDRYTFEIVLRRPYPQMLYWMTMNFFAPVPPEALEFFEQTVMLKRNLEFDKNLVGTGPFKLEKLDPTNEIVYVRNDNFRGELYPTEPVADADDAEQIRTYKAMSEAGVFAAAGQPLPMFDRIVYRMEKEAITRWNKFRQGYYDFSSVDPDLFDETVTLSSHGDPALTKEMKEDGIRLMTSYPMVVSYFVFNMRDEVYGDCNKDGTPLDQQTRDRTRKLRQAVAIALDTEKQIDVFSNGQGIPAHSPIPPGVFGYQPGEAGINKTVYRWDKKRQRGVRRSLDEARALLAEAGYPNGIGSDGQRLELKFATTGTSPRARMELKFLKKQLEQVGIDLITEVADGNRHNTKLREGTWQFTRGGWQADYPDPENFMFLLYGPNGAVATGGGVNCANYVNDEFDTLHRKMESMENSAERMKIVRDMVDILQRDTPWVFRFHPVRHNLYPRWLHNAYPHPLAANEMKYWRIDVADRKAYRAEQNRPNWLPIIIFAAALVAVTIPAIIIAARQFREG